LGKSLTISLSAEKERVERVPLPESIGMQLGDFDVTVAVSVTNELEVVLLLRSLPRSISLLQCELGANESNQSVRPSVYQSDRQSIHMNE
jgi:hypothetical protein